MALNYRQPPTFFCLLKRDTTNSSYSILVSNLPPTGEPVVQAFAEKQLQKNPPPSSSTQKQIGNIGSLPQRISPGANTPTPEGFQEINTLCYFYFVASENSTAWDYIILLIVDFDREEHFDLFRGELDGFSKKVVGLLTDNLDAEKKERIAAYLGKWYTLSVEYITRCMNNYGDKLDFVLHAAVQGKPISPSLFPNKHGLSQDTDLLRFMEALNIVSMLRSTARSDASTSSNLLLLDLQEEKDNVGLETNEFCQSWATALRDEVPKNPLGIRFLLEEKKCAIIQELNSIKRIVNDAKIDNYALYRAHRALSKGKNHDVLLSLLRSDETTDDQDFKDILHVLSLYAVSASPSSSTSLSSPLR